MNRCVICDKPITPQFWVCRQCEEKYGLVGVDYRDWPAWVKALVTIEQRNKRARHRIFTVPLGDDL